MRPATDWAFSAAERAAVYRAIGSRRDVRADFIGDEVSDDVLERVLAAANLAGACAMRSPPRT